MTWFRATFCAIALFGGLAGAAQALDTSAGQVRIEVMATGLEEPWSIGFLPDGRFLVTERDGHLTLFPAGGGAPVGRISGLPQVAAVGQGGLLDVLIPKDFAQSREVLLSYAVAQPGGGEGTAMGAGRLSEDGTRLEDFRQLFEMRPGSSGGRHFGSRMVETPDGTIFLTIGDRGSEPLAQDLARHEGAVLRLTRTGAAAGKGFGTGALPELYSKGHRNPQGAALDASGRLWVVEHGAQGGDEVNLIGAGRNYGWPVIAYGRDYGGGKIGSGTAAPGLEQPVMYWDPSIAPSGLMVYSGSLFPQWRGDIFTGSLKFDFISRLDPGADFAEERLQAPETGRVRDVRQGPDGAIWFLSVTEGAVFRIVPAS
ncbi:MAG: PQQ-dependent sugar dehydrogenase [Rhodobacter sp.]|nr:PQQ-dependent sugar dehydrogenase [Rhodobacter sp.]